MLCGSGPITHHPLPMYCTGIGSYSMMDKILTRLKIHERHCKILNVTSRHVFCPHKLYVISLYTYNLFVDNTGNVTFCSSDDPSVVDTCITEQFYVAYI